MQLLRDVRIGISLFFLVMSVLLALLFLPVLYFIALIGTYILMAFLGFAGCLLTSWLLRSRGYSFVNKVLRIEETVMKKAYILTPESNRAIPTACWDYLDFSFLPCALAAGVISILDFLWFFSPLKSFLLAILAGSHLAVLTIVFLPVLTCFAASLVWVFNNSRGRVVNIGTSEIMRIGGRISAILASLASLTVIIQFLYGLFIRGGLEMMGGGIGLIILVWPPTFVATIIYLRKYHLSDIKEIEKIFKQNCWKETDIVSYVSTDF